MSAVQVPVELVERVVARLTHQSAVVHDHSSADSGHAQDVWEVCDGLPCRADRELVEQLQALLPKPAPVCPNCGHLDADHTLGNDEDFRAGCYFDTEAAPGVRCGCALTRHALPQVRALIATERSGGAR